MSRITIGPFIVGQDMRESLRREVEATGAPQGEIVRRALMAYLGSRQQRGPAVPETVQPIKRSRCIRSES